jgi:hypothetical protein
MAPAPLQSESRALGLPIDAGGVVEPHAFAPLISTWLSGIRSPLKVVGTLAEIRAYRLVIAHQTLLRPMGE